jgi:hypothetical protein
VGLPIASADEQRLDFTLNQQTDAPQTQAMKTIIQSGLVLLTFVCLAVALPTMQAVVPPPDGGYPGANTAEGQNALFSLTTGGFNSAAGWLLLRSDTSGSFNTAVGAATLFRNIGDENTATGGGALLSNSTGRQLQHGQPRSSSF